MKTAKFYAIMADCIRDFCALEEIPEDIAHRAKNDPCAAIRSPLPALRILGNLIQMQLEAEKEMMTEEGRGSALSAAKSILKAATRPGLGGAWVDDAGRQCFCSGYHAARLLEPLQGVPVSTEKNPFPGLDDAIGNPRAHTIPAPSVSELKAHIAKTTADRPDLYKGRHKKPVLYDFGAPAPVVDASKLLDILQILPDAVISWDDAKKPLHFSSPSGDGVLCPMNPKIREGERVTA